MKEHQVHQFSAATYLFICAQIGRVQEVIGIDLGTADSYAVSSAKLVPFCLCLCNIDLLRFLHDALLACLPFAASLPVCLSHCVHAFWLAFSRGVKR